MKSKLYQLLGLPLSFGQGIQLTPLRKQLIVATGLAMSTLFVFVVLFWAFHELNMNSI